MEMKNSPIDVILYDLGNVILPFSHYQIAEKLSRFSQNEFQDPSRLFSYLFDAEAVAINGYELGKISSVAFFDSLKKTFGLSLSFERFVPIWDEIFTENKEVSNMILSQKGAWKLGLVSNTNPLHFDYCLKTFPVLRAFDKWILSHEVGYKKPSVEIFQKAIGWASVEPRRILFIDDIKMHVEAAISTGMQGIHFISASRLREALSVILEGRE